MKKWIKASSSEGKYSERVRKMYEDGKRALEDLEERNPDAWEDKVAALIDKCNKKLEPIVKRAVRIANESLPDGYELVYEGIGELEPWLQIVGPTGEWAFGDFVYSDGSPIEYNNETDLADELVQVMNDEVID